MAQRIRQLRKFKGMTQEQLAKEAGLSVMSIRRYEAMERVPNNENLQRIADALGTTIIDLDPPPMWKYWIDENNVEHMEPMCPTEPYDDPRQGAKKIKEIAQSALDNIKTWEFNDLSKLLAVIGIRITLSDDGKQYSLTDGKKKVPISEDEMKALARTSKASIKGIVEDFMKSPDKPAQK